MNRYLENGYKFEVEEKKGSFEIKETIGRGASCVVYRADFTDENGNITEHILKEYNPKHIEFFREETGKLVLESEDDSEEFVLGLEHFISGYQKQLNIRKITELKNATTNIQDIYCANSTQYIDMTCFNGLTYSKVNEKSLYDLLRRIKALTCVIANYHNAGFLHLDIKPENIYTIPETTEFLMLFDFDSVVEKNSIGTNSVLSYTMSWAAPEQITKNYNKICGATDIFAIGEILFYQIMGRHSEMKERRSFGEYQFDYDSEIFENVNPKVYPLLSEVFHKTICTAVDKRFQSAEELLSALENIIALADPKALFIKSSLPEPQNFFVGREKEIEEIHNRLENNRTLFVSGVGGIGKSELVKQYAKKYKNEYDAVIFAPYVSDMNMLIADDTAVPVYNLFKYPAEQPEEYMQRKWRKLKELCDEGTLIIVDNLDRDDDPDLNKLLELGCKLIITTRVDFSDYSYEQLDVRTLESREEINAIFNEYYKKPLDEKSEGFVREIIDIVDGHTMTVELLAKQMMAGRITPEKMLSKLRDGGIGDSGKEKVLTGKDGVRSAMRAYEHIRALFDVSDLSEDEVYILANLSLIPHTGVPTELFHDWCELDGYDGINELVHTGWVRCDKEKDFISLHPVIGDLAFDLLNERKTDPSKLMNGLTSFVKNKNLEERGFESSEEKADFLYKVSAKVIQIEEDFEAAAEFLTEASYFFNGFIDFKQSVVCCEKALEIMCHKYSDQHIKTARIYRTLADLYETSGDFKKCEQYCFKALDIHKRETDEENEDTADIYNILGLLYNSLNEFKKAEEYDTKALEAYRKVYGEEHSDTAISYNNLGVLYRELNDLAKAEDYQLKALEIERKIYGEEHTNTATIYCSLGTLYVRFGEIKKAEEYYTKALKICRKVYGERHVETAFAYNNLGKFYDRLSDFTKAEEYYIKALEIRTKVYGEEHTETAWSYLNLGSHYVDICELTKAEGYLIKALEVYKKVYGEEHTVTSVSYNNLGYLYGELGDFTKAEEYHTKALEIRRKVYGEEHTDTAWSYSNLGEIYGKLSDLAKAEGYHTKALEIYKKVYGEEHTDTATSYNNLGSIYDDLGEFKKAEEYYTKALEIRKNVYGEEHTATAESYNNLGYLYGELGDLAKAEDYQLKALEIDIKIYGEEHMATATSYNNLGSLYDDLGEFKKAEEYYTKALEIYKKVYGEEHTDTAISYNNLGVLYRKLNDLVKAEEYCTKALEIRRNVYGEEHTDTTKSYNNLGYLYGKLGDLVKAEEYYTKALEFCRKVYGEEHPDTATSYNNLGRLYSELNGLVKSEEYYTKALEIHRKVYGEKHEKTLKVKEALLELKEQQ